MTEREDPKGAGDPLIQHQAGVMSAMLGAMHKEDQALVMEFLGYQKIDDAGGATGATGGTLSAKKKGPTRPEMHGT